MLKAIPWAGSAARKAASKGPMRLGKPKAKAGGLGIKKATAKVDDSVFEQAPEVVATPATPPKVSF